jgi:hypothetical protein
VTRGPRDHGYGDAPTVAGAPRVGERVPGTCPHCACGTVFGIEVEVENPSPQLRRPAAPHKVIGRYVGCPACPWASPMMQSCELLPVPEVKP